LTFFITVWHSTLQHVGWQVQQAALRQRDRSAPQYDASATLVPSSHSAIAIAGILKRLRISFSPSSLAPNGQNIDAP
jgi:hypothetical protein